MDSRFSISVVVFKLCFKNSYLFCGLEGLLEFFLRLICCYCFILVPKVPFFFSPFLLGLSLFFPI